jgi:hypothetical protein
LQAIGVCGVACLSGLPPTLGTAVCAKADAEKPMIAATTSRVLIVVIPFELAGYWASNEYAPRSARLPVRNLK